MLINCQFCNKKFKLGRNTHGKYCSNACQGAERSLEVVNTWLNNPCFETFYHAGKQPRSAIRIYLIKQANYACTRCGWNKIHPLSQLPPLELEHIDGNWKNCVPSNIDIICPNCHSLTDSYKARNKGKGRNYRC